VRVLLNYGHTIGHAIEAATGYTEYLHGEAVSIGMMGAGMISARLGMLSERDLQRQRDLLEAYGLPVSCGGVDTDAVLRAMASDKKTVGGSIRWVLLEATGRAVTRDDVPREVIRAALRSLER
jgi:3-dehydroquinate synthase